MDLEEKLIQKESEKIIMANEWILKNRPYAEGLNDIYEIETIQSVSVRRNNK